MAALSSLPPSSTFWFSSDEEEKEDLSKKKLDKLITLLEKVSNEIQRLEQKLYKVREIKLLENQVTDSPKTKKFYVQEGENSHDLAVENGKLIWAKNRELFEDSPSSFATLIAMDIKGRVRAMESYGRAPRVHSMLFAGQPLIFAGTIQATQGRITLLSQGSEQYLPKLQHLLSFMLLLQNRGLDFKNCQVKTLKQRGEKRKKPFRANVLLAKHKRNLRKVESSIKKRLRVLLDQKETIKKLII